MSRRGDPPRLRTPGSGASKDARALLEASRADLPAAEQLARLAQRIPRLGGGGHAPPAPRTPAPPPAAAAGSGALGAATSIVPTALLGAALGLALLGGASLRGVSARVALPPSSPVVVASPAPSPEPTPPASISPPQEAPPDPPPSPMPSAPPARRAPAPPGAIVEAPAGPGLDGAASGPKPRARFAGPAAAETEMDLLRRAQQALPHHPALALAAAEEHGRRFREGTLVQEREVIAVSALVLLGRGEEAKIRAKHFEEAYPRSAHRAGLNALVRDLPSGRLNQNIRGERAPTP
jgi:hypothetical protein